MRGKTLLIIFLFVHSQLVLGAPRKNSVSYGCVSKCAAALLALSLSACQSYTYGEIELDNSFLENKEFESVAILATGVVARFEIDKSFPTDKKAMLLSDLHFMAGIAESEGTPLHQEVFGGNISGSTYLKWFSARVRKIFYDDNIDATEIAYEKEGAIYLTSNYFNESYDLEIHNQLFRVGSLFHEARHTDGYCHFKMPLIKDEAKDLFGGQELNLIDKYVGDYSAIGPYGVETILISNILNTLQIPVPNFLLSGNRIILPEERRRLNNDCGQ